MSDWVLSIDFGTTNTAAAFALLGQPPQAVRLSSRTDQLPSCVIRLESGTRVGDAARNAMMAAPESFVEAPKSLLGQHSVLLGAGEVTVVEIVADVLRVVVEKAQRVAGGQTLGSAILTHPQDWGGARLDALREAWALVGVDAPVRLVSEPVAAVTKLALAAPPPSGSRVAVLDYGGGTCDVAVLEVTTEAAQPLRVLAHGGNPDLGGRRLDRLALEWVYRQLPRDVVEALQQDLGASRTLMDQVRLAKEDLSEHEYADVAIQVGGRPASVQISRQEFEQTIAAEIDAVNALVGNVLAQADVSPQDLHALYLTGGSSSVRAVVTAMTTLIGDRPATLLDPKLVVALGAHEAAAPAPRPSFVAPWASVAEKPLDEVTSRHRAGAPTSPQQVPMLIELRSVKDPADYRKPVEIYGWLVEEGQEVQAGTPLAFLSDTPYATGGGFCESSSRGHVEKMLVGAGQSFRLDQTIGLFRIHDPSDRSRWPGAGGDRLMTSPSPEAGPSLRSTAVRTRIWESLTHRFPNGIWRGLVASPPGTFGIDRVVLAGDFHNEVGARTWNMGSPNSEFGRGFCWEVWASTGESGRAEEALPPFVLVLRAAWYDSYHDDDSPNVILLTEDVTRSVWEYQYTEG